MNHYLYSIIKEKSTGFAGIVIDADEIMELLRVQLPCGAWWLKEDEMAIRKCM